MSDDAAAAASEAAAGTSSGRPGEGPWTSCSRGSGPSEKPRSARDTNYAALSIA